LRNGVYPDEPPTGYLNEMRGHTIIIDKPKDKLVRKTFELYSTGEYTLDQLRQISNDIELTSNRGKPMKLSIIHRMLSNPFYYGIFTFKGELYEGTHEPIITKKLFDRAQEVLKRRGKNHKRKTVHNFIFTGLMKCENCGCAITAETKKGHIYYRCTKKKDPCDEKYTREELLVEQFLKAIKKVSVLDSWIEEMLLEVEQEKKTELEHSSVRIKATKDEIKRLESKLDNLLDSPP
jgi:hypothetical protein